MNHDERVNILLVDDQAARLLSYEAILLELGERLVMARSGAEALKRLMEDEFAVILLDVNMPGMDGFETAQLIHRHPRFERTPIIFVTAINVTDLDRLEGYKLGAIDYVYVPVQPEILRSKVMVLVELHRKRRELESLNQLLSGRNAELARAHAELAALRAQELEELNRTLEQTNRQLRETDRRKDEFLAILGHELRNPLAPISNAAHILRRRAAADSEAGQLSHVIERQAAHLTRLVDDLLDVSRITRGKIELRLAPIDLATVVERAVEASRPLIEEGRHRLSLDLPEAPVVVHGDAVRLAQVVGNLLNNAAKYTHPGGEIRLQLGVQDGSAEIRVRDSGIGIPAERIVEIFDAFTQVDSSLAQARGGLGIGLALVRRLIDMHGGRVRAHSPGRNCGSEFVLNLPLSHAPASADPTAVPEVSSPRSGPCRRILVADDNPDSALTLSIMLRMEGHDVITAADGVQALEAAHRFRPDVAVLDLGMPRLDGYETARRIRSEPWGAAMTLIALTGWGQADDRRRTHEAGFDQHRVKPVSPQQILEIIASSPGQSREGAQS